LYDIINKVWKKHFTFEDKVVSVFRNEKDAWDFNIGIFFDNNKV